MNNYYFAFRDDLLNLLYSIFLKKIMYKMDKEGS